jgi:hypothetical protein
MSEARKRNTAGSIAHAKLRAEQTRQHVDQVIALLLRENKPINFNAVARASGVTKAYLYSQSSRRERIEALRQQQTKTQSRHMPSQGRTDASKDMLLAAKDRRIKQLEEEKQHLQMELKVALGKAYDRL